MNELEQLKQENEVLKKQNASFRSKILELQQKLQNFYKQSARQYILDHDHIPYSDEEYDR